MEKEVVHVPTKELAKEVLRVAQENGYNTTPLDKDIEGNYYKENLCFELKPMNKISLFAGIEYFEDHEYSIISAQEFLNRYIYSELDQLRKENEELRSINDTLNKENLEHHNELTLLKEKLKAIEDQPKVGDVCLFWDDDMDLYVLGLMDSNGGLEGVCRYDNCVKATPENIQAKINELKK